MLSQLGNIILSIAFLYLILLFFQQFRRARADQVNHNLKQSNLKDQFNNLLTTKPEPAQTDFTWSGWRKFRIDKVVEENDTIKSFYFAPVDGDPLAKFKPGQHLTFQLKIPGRSKPVIRCYSLSNSSNRKTFYRVSIKKQLPPPNAKEAPSGVASCYFHDELSEDDVLDVRAPSGKFYLDLAKETPIVLIAGGIGLTPSLSMLDTLFDNRSERKIHLLYAVQNKNEQIMEKRFVVFQKKLMNFSFHRFYTDCDESELNDNVHQGFINCSLMPDLGIEFSSDFYVCGPPPMMNAMVDGLKSQGVSEDRIHFESFGPASVKKKPEKPNLQLVASA